MTKLYYTPSSCGAASFIAGLAAGLHFQVEQVYLDCHKTASDVDFYTINPKGNVPCLILDDGTILNENISVLQYIADQHPGSVSPEYGTLDRYLVINALGFLNSEVFPCFRELIQGPNGEVKSCYTEKLAKHFTYLEKHVLKGENFLVGNKFSIADIYLYMMLNWDVRVGFDLSPFPQLLALRERVGGLHEVVAAKLKMDTNPTCV